MQKHPMVTLINESIITKFNSAFLEDGTIFLSQSIDSLSLSDSANSYMKQIQLINSTYFQHTSKEELKQDYQYTTQFCLINNQL